MTTDSFNTRLPSKNTVWTRILSQWKLKLFLTLTISLAHWSIYFGLERLTFFPKTLIPSGPIDHLIPFSPNLAIAYASLNFLVPVAPVLMVSSKQLIRFSIGLISVLLCGYLVFFFFPTTCPRPPLEAGTNSLYRWIVKIDYPLNAFPSLHAAIAVYAALGCNRIMNSIRHHRAFIATIWIWTAVILYTTLATKQHVFADVFAGVFLGISGYFLFVTLERSAIQTPDLG